ncbi:MAG: zf-HC2 domain-containing protein [Acidobacteria bacterium]|nr:zf-HC2 domain-containing protein [Acidobacteriota bacterium]
MKEECSQFESQLSDLLAGILPLPASIRAQEHMSSCRKCRRLYKTAVGELDLLAPGAGQSLAVEILKKTSGPACQRAQDGISEFIDGALTPGDSRILFMHLQACPSCAEILRTLTETRSAFRPMARIQPGTGFTEEVLAATTRRSVPADPGKTGSRRWRTDLLHRPRLAWELAYLFTLILLVTVGNPALMSMDALRGKVRFAWTVTAVELERVSAAGLAGVEGTAEHVGERMGRRLAEAEQSLGSLWDRSRKITAAVLATDITPAGMFLPRIRTILLNIGRGIGLDRTFSRAMRYLEWMR